MKCFKFFASSCKHITVLGFNEQGLSNIVEQRICPFLQTTKRQKYNHLYWSKVLTERFLSLHTTSPKGDKDF